MGTACAANLLLNLAYGIPTDVVRRFRRSALVDVDPGLTQIWINEGELGQAPHDTYFTIGETPDTTILAISRSSAAESGGTSLHHGRSQSAIPSRQGPLDPLQ